MRSLRFVFYVLLLSLSTVAFAQSDAQKSDAHKSDAQKPDTQKSDMQKSFDRLKSLAGSWEGQVATLPVAAEIEGKSMQVTFRVTSMGNALMHEMSGAGRPDDPITMLYMDGDRLMLTHYCDAGNRPRMTAKSSPDGKTIEFDFLDVAGSTKYGHMHHAVFTLLDANHHIEDWTFMVEGKQGPMPMRAHFDLQRTK